MAQQGHRHKVVFSQKLQSVQLQRVPRHYLQRPELRPLTPLNRQGAATPRTEESAMVDVRELEIAEWKTCEALLQVILASLQQQRDQREQALIEIQQVAIELAVALASHLVHHAIEQEQFHIEEMVAAALAGIEDELASTVVLNPDDAALLKRRMNEFKAAQRLEQLTILTDAGIPRGGCVVQSADGTAWMSSMSIRLASIRKHWLEELDESQIERRKTEGSHSSLRRFPDRRETA